MLLRHLRDAIVQGDFDGLNGYYGCYHAAFEISEPLDLWFRNTDNDTILRQIICWLAALYRFNPDSQSIKEEQLYPPVFQEVRQVASEFFAFEKDPYTLEVDEEISIYHDAALAYYGSIPPKLLWCPAPLLLLSPWSSESASWGAHNNFDVNINRFYFTHSDWERIVLEGDEDDLLRVESSKEYWQRIKHQYVAGAGNRNSVFSLYESPAEKGQVYLIRAADSGHYKIGFTNGDPNQRLAQLQTGNSHPLSLVGSFSCVGKSTEKLLHDFFAKVRLTGEWFMLTDEEVKGVLSELWRAERNIF